MTRGCSTRTPAAVRRATPWRCRTRWTAGGVPVSRSTWPSRCGPGRTPTWPAWLGSRTSPARDCGQSQMRSAAASRSSCWILDSFKRTGLDQGVETPDFPQRLRDAGLRVTRQRLAVLGALADLAHADTESVIHAVRRDLPDVSHQAIYDSLRALTTAGLARRI